MYVELLSTPPISGTYTERQFDVSARTNTWVRFEDEEAEAWVGVFGRSELASFDAVVPFSDDGGRTVLVIAGGQGYIVDAAAGTLLRQTPWDYAYTAITVPGQEFVLVADATEIWASSRTGDRPAWRRDRAWYDYDEARAAHRVAVDGVVFDHVTSDTLSGKVWEMDGWYAFQVRLPDLEFARGELLTVDWETFGHRPPAG